MALIEQEVSQEPIVEIPQEVRDAYRLWRPTPLVRAPVDVNLVQDPDAVFNSQKLVYSNDDPGGSTGCSPSSGCTTRTRA